MRCSSWQDGWSAAIPINCAARGQLSGRDDGVTALTPVQERYPDFANFLSEEPDAGMIERLRGAESIGRPLGNRKFLDAIERKIQRVLKPAKRGPKPRGELAISELSALSP